MHNKETTQISYLGVKWALVIFQGAGGTELGSVGQGLGGMVDAGWAPCSPCCRRTEQLCCSCLRLHFSTAYAQEEFTLPPVLFWCLQAGACSDVPLEHLWVLSVLRDGDVFCSEVFKARDWLTLALETSMAAVQAAHTALPVKALQQQISVSGSIGSLWTLGYS